MQAAAGEQDRAGIVSRVVGFVRTLLDANKRYGADRGGYLVASLTYYTFLSLFPLLLLAIAVLGFVLARDPALQRDLAAGLTDAVPGLGPLIGDNISAVVRGRAGAGVIGILGLLWTGAGAAEAAGHALARVFGAPEPTGLIRRKGWALGATVGLGALLLLPIGVAGVLGALRPAGIVGVIASMAVVLVLDALVFVLGYRVLLPGRRLGWRSLWPGATFAATGWAVLKLVGASYGARTVAGASAVYGVFASTLGVLVLLYLAARLFVLGAELNAVLIEREQQQGGAGMDPPRRESPSQRPDGGKPVSERTTGELVYAVATDSALLVRKEIELARQELTAAVTSRIKAVAMLGAAVPVAFLAVIFLALTASAALEGVVAGWLARLIVAGVLLVIAGIAVAIGLPKLKRPPLAPEAARQRAKEDIGWAKEQLKR